MAADSFCEQGNVVWESPDKLFSMWVERHVQGYSHESMISKPEMVVVGSCGRAAISSMVRYDLAWPELPFQEDTADEWAHKVAHAWFNHCRDRRHMLDDELDPRGAFLLGWRSYLWEISADLALPVEHYASIGSGGPVAQGAIYAAHQCSMYPERPAEDIVLMAAEAAAQHAAGCRGPFRVLST
jgi:hypothetical protein